MIYRVRIEDRIFNVEIENINSRPIIALVDGEPFEIWTEGNGYNKSISASSPDPAGCDQIHESKETQVENHKNGESQLSKLVQSPIPGVIVSVSVNEGDKVGFGQELCILEAMKMKNVIRSSREGIISTVKVQPGMHVQHREVLFELE